MPGATRLAAARRAPIEPFPAAVEMLAARAYSVAELKQKLRGKNFAEPSIHEAITRLKELGFLDDRRLAENYASALVRNRTLGRFRVERELKMRRVDPRTVQPALEKAFEETDERALLERALEQKMRTLRLPLTRTRLASLCNTLRRRGFRSDDILKAVRARPELSPVTDVIDFENLEE